MLTVPQDVMLARAVNRLPEAGVLSGGCGYEPKWDGYRALVFRPDSGVVVQSRRGSDLTGAFPDIVAAAVTQLPAGVVLDGELVVWGEAGLDFSALQTRMVAPRRARALAAQRPASFVAFDLLAVNGRDIRSQPLRERRKQLELLMEQAKPPLQLTPHTTDLAQARAWLVDYAAAHVGVEGLVIKGLGERYQPGRRGWLKFRIRHTTEAVVGAVIGARDNPQRLVLGLYDASGSLRIAGGTSLLQPRERTALGSLLRPPAGTHPWPAELPAGRMGHFGGGRIAVTLVEPSLVVDISADSAFEHGKWRHITTFVRTRPDLVAVHVRLPGGR
jgi:ATP-dependent DNA ligase